MGYGNYLYVGHRYSDAVFREEALHRKNVSVAIGRNW